jgi:hypothetical protein
MPPFITQAEVQLVIALVRDAVELEKAGASMKLAEEALALCRTRIPGELLRPLPTLVSNPRVYEVGKHAIAELTTHPGLGLVKFIEANDGTQIMVRRGSGIMFGTDGSVVSFLGKVAIPQKWDGAGMRVVDGVEQSVVANYKRILEEVGIDLKTKSGAASESLADIKPLAFRNKLGTFRLTQAPFQPPLKPPLQSGFRYFL